MFKPLTVGRLPRVMVKTLALGVHEQVVIRELLHGAVQARLDAEEPQFVPGDVLARTGGVAPRARGDVFDGENLAADFAAVLEWEKRDRAVFVDLYTAVLDRLLAEDFFGTEGQLDPRGDHRDND